MFIFLPFPTAPFATPVSEPEAQRALFLAGANKKLTLRSLEKVNLERFRGGGTTFEIVEDFLSPGGAERRDALRLANVPQTVRIEAPQVIFRYPIPDLFGPSPTKVSIEPSVLRSAASSPAIEPDFFESARP